MKTETTAKPKGKGRNRPGNRHDEDNVLFGGYVPPEFKALAMLTTNKLKIRNTLALMKDGVYAMATKAGIMRNNEILPQFKPVIAELAKIIREKNRAARARAKARAAAKQKEGAK